jgi:UDP-N-acetylglucosamine acyltransferase
VGISGHVSVDDYTVFGGMVGVHQFVRIGSYCMIGGLYRVTKDVPHFTLAAGDPLRLMGLNSVGLKRANFSPETLREIRSFYRELYGKERAFTQSFNEALKKKAAYGPEVRSILEFYEGSKRGITFWR